MTDDYDWTPHLEEGEEVLWQGRPDQRRFILTALDVWSLLVLAIGYAIMAPLAVGRWTEAGDWRPGLVLLIAIPIVLLMRLVLEPKTRRSQYYALTDRRALVGIGAKPSKLQQFHLRPDSHIWRSGWRFPIIAFSRKKPGLLAALEPFLRFDGPQLSPIGGGVRGAEITFLVPEDPHGVIEMARQIGANRTP